MVNEKLLIDVDDIINKLEKEIADYPTPNEDDTIFEKFQKRLVPKLIRNVIEYIKAQPTVDAVEVVHCENCERHAGCILEDLMYAEDPTAVRYCSRGERRKEWLV